MATPGRRIEPVGIDLEPDVVDELVEHLVTTTAMPPGVAARVVAEVTHYFSETVETFVRRRHRELQATGMTNPAIFARLADELGSRRFMAPELTERQLRRTIYG